MRDGETRRKKVEWKKAKQKMNDNWLEKVSEEIEKKKKKKPRYFFIMMSVSHSLFFPP